MTDPQDPFRSLLGIAAFRRGDPYEELEERVRRPHWEMAANVLHKARAVLAADPAKAGRYVDTALRLPRDESEQQTPAALEAHMMLYNLVTDAAELDEGDAAWLDAAIEVMEASGPVLAPEMRVVLHSIGHDYQLPPAELPILRAALTRVRPGPTLDDQDFPDELLKERILEVLALCDRYADALAERLHRYDP